MFGFDEALPHETIGVIAQRRLADLVTDADHAHLDAEAIHLVQRDAHRILRAVELLGYLAEQVLDGKVEVLRAVLELRANEVVLFEVARREADHRVDDADVGGHGHGGLLRRKRAGMIGGS